MKKTTLILGIVLFIGLGFLYYKHFTEKERILYIDTNILMSKYNGMKDARAEIEKKSAEMQANVETWDKEGARQPENLEKLSMKKYIHINQKEYWLLAIQIN